ncbi:MAG: ABC transporter ATP-binding protein [Poseidonibacter sp.]|uniref:ABC transporter ATP-binding protein n=1 Tax=Poseidonibacter sp. TaxID=2321188 RepID=UPI00359CFAA0
MLNINIENKNYQNKQIISKLKLQIHNGEFISIIGPSGCGKTTLLNIISNLDKEYNGEISLDNKKDLDIGFMFQDSRIIPWLSVFDNIMLVSKEKNEADIISLLSDIGLKDYIYSFPKELSGGMKRRVSLVRAFINKPKLLLLDEPFISLDYPTAQSLRADFIRFYKKYLPTVIFVTHDLKEAISLSNRIVFLDSKPMKVVLDYKKEIDFTQDLESLEIEKHKLEILEKYPLLLSGKIQ